MALNVKTLLKDKNVLYVVMFVSVANFFVYLLTHNWTASIIFILITYLTTYFSKNMIVVLLSALVGTNMIIASRMVGRKIEAMTTRDGGDESGNDGGKSDGNDDVNASGNINGKSNGKNGAPKKKETYTNKSDINYAATLENAYDNLDNLIGKDGIDKMSTDTAKLVSQQNKLLKNLENMAPLLENAGKLLNSMPVDSINKIQSSLGGLMGNLKGISAQ